MCKIFADDTTIFSKVLKLDKSVTELKISQWTNEWKTQFNPDPKEQVTEVILSCKLVSSKS